MWTENSEKRRRSFSDEAEAIAEANRLLDFLVAGRPQMAELPKDAAQEYAAALALIELTKLPLVTVCREFMRTWTPDFKKATVRTVINECLDANRDFSPKYRNDLKYRLASFRKTFGSRWIDEVTAAEVRTWIEERAFKGKPVSNRTRTNWLRILCSVWAFAQERDHLAKDKKHNLQGIKAWRHNPASYSFMKWGDLVMLLGLCNNHKGRDQLLPFVALQAFGGIRTEEAKRLTYEDLVIRDGQVVAININAHKSKTRTRRTIDVQPALASYLHEQAVLWRRTGKIAKWTKIDLIMHRLLKELKFRPVEWKHNQLRHTFATHLLRLWGDAAKVADYLGTSPSMINSHYRELAHPDETEKWFSMRHENPKGPPPPPARDPNEPRLWQTLRSRRPRRDASPSGL
jgi:integrase